jgi:hypothetical protein
VIWAKLLQIQDDEGRLQLNNNILQAIGKMRPHAPILETPYLVTRVYSNRYPPSSLSTHSHSASSYRLLPLIWPYTSHNQAFPIFALMTRACATHPQPRFKCIRICKEQVALVNPLFPGLGETPSISLRASIPCVGDLDVEIGFNAYLNRRRWTLSRSQLSYRASTGATWAI